MTQLAAVASTMAAILRWAVSLFNALLPGKGCKIHPVKVMFQLHDIFLVFSKINVRLHNKYKTVLEVPSICRFIFSV